MIDTFFLSAANHLLARSGWARARLQAHAGKRARFDITPLSIAFSVSSDGHLASCSSDEAPDVTLELPLSESPLVLSGGIEALMAKVRIEGNAEFADAIGFVFRNLRWDLEEDLSTIIGDIAAHRVVSTGVALGEAQKRFALGLTGNALEYLTEEKPLLITRPMISELDEEIRMMRDAVARLEKRIDKVHKASRKR